MNGFERSNILRILLVNQLFLNAVVTEIALKRLQNIINKLEKNLPKELAQNIFQFIPFKSLFLPRNEYQL